METGEVVLSLVGGLGGALLLRVLEALIARRREHRDALAILQVLLDEVHANVNVEHGVGVLGIHRDVVEPLRSAAYDAHEVALARILPTDVRSQVAHQYGSLRASQASPIDEAMLRRISLDEADYRAAMRLQALASAESWLALDGALSRVMKNLGEEATSPADWPNVRKAVKEELARALEAGRRTRDGAAEETA